MFYGSSFNDGLSPKNNVKKSIMHDGYMYFVASSTS